MALVYGPGLALYLYPGELLKFGASHTMPADEAVTAEHYFLCLRADAREGLWTPLHVTRGMDRLPIPDTAKAGHPRFAQGISWYSTADLWRIPHKAIQRSSLMAGDKSTEKSPNRVAPGWIPERALFPAQVPDRPAAG
jgi:hypothetical protein